ncbi:MAG: DUF4261 domain-containing protein [Candidatus Gastranaerophilales bacterium]|nr:DUF4261 domain-containing protein [Candidatus Gastranaerophilales bacterium]
MGLFDRFKKKVRPVETDTLCLLLMGRVMEDAAYAGTVFKQKFGSDAVGEIDQSDAPLTHMVVKLEGIEFWCSYMPFPVPPEEMKIPDTPQYSMFNVEEYQTLCDSKSFWIVAQKGGAQSLADKRRICCAHTRLMSALLELEGAVGVYASAAELLISRRMYLYHADILKKNAEDPEYFPAALWISIKQGQKGDMLLMGTWGLRQFGFLELWFLEPKSHWSEIHEKLYLMSIFQITEKELYRDGDTIAFTEGNITTFKEMSGALFLVGGDI